MPLVILLDNSLSMYKQLKGEENSEHLTKREIANLIIRRILQHLKKLDSFETVALIIFSSFVEQIVQFTNDYKEIETCLENLKAGDCSNLEEVLNAASDLVVDEYASFFNVQMLLLTDNLDNLYGNTTKQFCTKLKDNRSILKEYYLSLGVEYDEKMSSNSLVNDDILRSTYYLELKKKSFFQCKFPFSFGNRFDIICLDESTPTNDETSNEQAYYSFNDDEFKVEKLILNESKKKYLQELIELNNSNGKLYVTNMLERSYVENEFCETIINEMFVHYEFQIQCGHLASTVRLVPSPLPFKGFENYKYVEKEISKCFEVCGFVTISELATPQTYARHLVFYDYNEEEPSQTESTNESEESFEKEFNPGCFALLLHSNLKTEGTAAIVTLGKDWYGAIHCWTNSKSESKNKSYLMISLFEPGNCVIRNIVLKATFQVDAANQPNRPIAMVKSYNKSCIVWYRQNNLESDLQKVIRNAKKMQEKMQIFYKELNKVRKAALSFGFYEVFDGLARMLERELTTMSTSNNLNPETLLQLTHCINCLRSVEYRDYRKDIQPFVANAPSHRKM